jgi:hypothetical protein
VAQFQALDTNWVFSRGTNNVLRLENGNEVSNIELDPAAGNFQVVENLVTYVLHPDGVLWREQPTPFWTSSMVDASVAAFSAVDSTNVYVLGTDGVLWNEHGGLKDRVRVDSSVQAFLGLNAQEVLVLGTNANLWREIGTATTRDFVDGNVFIDSTNPHRPYFAWQPDVSDINIFVMGSDRKLWLEGVAHGNGSSGGSTGGSPPGSGGAGGTSPAPACFSCYANCGNGCLPEGTFCSLNAAYSFAAGCSVCCGTAAECSGSSACAE